MSFQQNPIYAELGPSAQRCAERPVDYMHQEASPAGELRRRAAIERSQVFPLSLARAPRADTASSRASLSQVPQTVDMSSRNGRRGSVQVMANSVSPGQASIFTSLVRISVQ